MDRETRVINRGFELRADGQNVYLEGYAAVYYDPQRPEETQYRLWGDTWERIMPGAFDEALRRPDDVRALFNHDPNLVLGRLPAKTLTLRVDAVGLWFSALLPATEFGRSLAESVRRGDVSGCSFSFEIGDVGEAVWREEGDKTYREILNLRLFDVGPVTFPAYKGTDVTVAQRSHAVRKPATPPIGLATLERSHRIRQAVGNA